MDTADLKDMYPDLFEEYNSLAPGLVALAINEAQLDEDAARQILESTPKHALEEKYKASAPEGKEDVSVNV